MKASELVELLQDEIKHHGDKEVIVAECGCLEEKLHLYPALGWYADAENSYISLACYECDADFRSSEIAAGECFE